MRRFIHGSFVVYGYALADVFAAPFIKNSNPCSASTKCLFMVFPRWPIESIAYVIALVGMPFVIIIPMTLFASISEDYGVSSRPCVLGRKIERSFKCPLLYPALSPWNNYWAALFIPKYSLDDLIAFEMFRLITSFWDVLSFFLLSGLNRSGIKNKDYSLVNLSTVVVSLITLAVIFGIS